MAKCCLHCSLCQRSAAWTGLLNALLMRALPAALAVLALGAHPLMMLFCCRRAPPSFQAAALQATACWSATESCGNGSAS